MQQRISGLLVIALLFVAGCQQATETPAPTGTPVATAPVATATPEAEIPDLFEQVGPSVVAVIRPDGIGSGVIWDADGLIVTNEHVVHDADDLVIVFGDGQRFPGELVAADERTDVAIIRVDRTGLPPATFSDVAPRVGELALAIGSPAGFENSLTVGVVSGLNRTLPGAARNGASLVDLIQTDAAISPGSSGGALVNDAGEVIGINIAYIPPNLPGQPGAVSLGFAIPATTVTAVVGQLLDRGRVAHAYLGAQLTTLTAGLAERYEVGADGGAVVLDVAPGGPAETAGIEAGDVIVSIGETTVTTVEDLMGELRRSEPGDVLSVVVVRDQEERSISVTLAERPDE
jgi:S1-C subfamily serine protease